MKTVIFKTQKEFNDHNQRETYRGDARELLMAMGNRIIEQQNEIDKLKTTNYSISPNLDVMVKQLNDLHTIVMSQPVPSKRARKEVKIPKKDRVNEILAKRAFDAAIKSN